MGWKHVECSDCHMNILSQEEDGLCYKCRENKRLKKDNNKAYHLLADVRDILLDVVNPVGNPCGDMLNCTVSSPRCIKCLANHVKGEIERLKKENEKNAH